MSDGDDPVDLGVIRTLDDVFGSTDETDEVLRDFLENAESWVRSITREGTATVRSDGHRAAHTLAASAAMVGAVALSRTVRGIERRFVGGTLPTEDVGLELERELERVQAAWREIGRPRSKRS